MSPSITYKKRIYSLAIKPTTIVLITFIIPYTNSLLNQVNFHSFLFVNIPISQLKINKNIIIGKIFVDSKTNVTFFVNLLDIKRIFSPQIKNCLLDHNLWYSSNYSIPTNKP